jgi:hypothetical protein
VNEVKWSEAEKQLARRVFGAALAAELAEAIADFKTRAAAVVEPDDMWAIEAHLHDKRLEFDRKYDYRYSQLISVFGHLLREGRIQVDQLAGLSEEKLQAIRLIASF